MKRAWSDKLETGFLNYSSGFYNPVPELYRIMLFDPKKINLIEIDTNENSNCLFSDFNNNSF